MLNKLTDFRNRFNAALKEEFKPKAPDMEFIGGMSFAIAEVPKIIEKKTSDYVLWGADNLYPQKISELKYGSGIHNAIISTATDMISGDGFLLNKSKTPEESLTVYNSLSPEQKSEWDRFTLNPNNESLEEINRQLAQDAKEYGGICYEVVFNQDWTKVVTIKYVDIRNVRAGKMENDKVASYFICRDWEKSKTADYRPKEIKAVNFKDPKSTGSYNQLVYKKKGKLDYYPEPDYIGCLTWIQIDYQMGIFHLANIENGMNPSLWWKFYKKPGSEQDKQLILDDLRHSYKGAGRAGKHIVTFSEGKELAPDITPIAVTNLDKQQIVLSQLCDQKILTGNKLTSPLLAGISTAGQMGGNTELEKAYMIYDKSRMKPYRNMIAGSYNEILDFNKSGFQININPFNPFNG